MRIYLTAPIFGTYRNNGPWVIMRSYTVLLTVPECALLLNIDHGGGPTWFNTDESNSLRLKTTY
jgi:hypothetical protein